MNQGKLLPRLIAGILVALFFGLALYLRAVLPHDAVFVGDWIKFTGTDAYDHMTLVDNLAHNLPHHSSFNPYLIYPGGGGITFSFFEYLLAGVIWLIGLGSPTQHVIDLAGVYYPAILGALTVVPVYFIGKALFNRWVGVMAAGLIAILPGEFLGRSILGFTDQHVAETLFSSTAMLFLILAIKAGQGKFTFDHLRKMNWAVIAKPLIYSLFAGIFLGIYLLTWVGALLFVFIIFVYFVIQSIIDHLRGNSNDYLCFIGTVIFFVVSVMFLPIFSDLFYIVSMVIALLAPVLLVAVSRLMASRGLRPAYYPLALVIFGLVGLVVFYVVSPSLLRSMLENFGIFIPSGASLTIMEAQPMLFPGGEFSLDVVWGNFTTGFYISLGILVYLIYLIIKRPEADKTLLIVWSLMILAATLGQRRFAYYFAVNVAVLTGYFSWGILQFVGFREAAEPMEVPQRIEKKDRKKAKRKSSSRISPVNMALGLIIVLFFVFYPNIGPMPKIGAWPAGTKLAIDIPSHPQFAPSDAWYESLTWMKDNTPDPFGDPDFYYKVHEAPFNYPDTAYGVTAWWDYGYWIARIGHRLPTSNPGQGYANIVAQVFISQDEASATKIMDQYGLNSKYAIIDLETATSKFFALPAWAGSRQEEFYDVYYQQQGSKLVYGVLYYPEYYRSLVVRLYNFNTRQVVPESTTVISYEKKLGSDGQPYKEITSVKSFSTYRDAEVYVSEQKSGNYRIVGSDPFVSPVPLPALEDYKLIYSSSSSVERPNGGAVPEVKIFEYTGKSTRSSSS
jgi:oligosaccharyl transferase (archaeosortase A-associated)